MMVSPARRHASGHVFAVLSYALCAWIVTQHGFHLGRMVAGDGADPFIYIWFLSWWPYALSHHLNPLFTHLVWQPSGLNLAWTTSIPSLALLAAPLTLTLGPVVSYNLLCLAAPILGAASAYALCLYITRQRLPAWFGGFLFAFSSYAMARQNDQLNLSFTALVPLLVLLALARIDGRIGRRGAVGGAVVLLALQAGISLEIFATLVLAGGFAWALTWLMLPARRSGMRMLLLDCLWVLPFLLLALAPLLWAIFAWRRDIHLPEAWPDFFSTDLLNLIIPTATTWLGGRFFLPLSQHFPGLTCEQGGYLGLPLVTILWVYLRRTHRYFFVLFLGLLLAMLGPHLWIGGRQTPVPLPWAVFRAMPLLGNALPARLALYVSLLAAMIAALWMARAPNRWRLVVAGLVVLFIWPMPRPMQTIPATPLFAPARFAEVFGKNPKLLILPFGFNGQATYWQVQSRFGFAQTGGYLGFPPVQAQRLEPIIRLYLGYNSPNLAQSLAAYCQSTGTDFIVITPGTQPDIRAQIMTLGWPARTVDDVTILTVPSVKHD